MKTKIKLEDILDYFFKVQLETPNLTKPDELIAYLWLRGYKIVPIEDEIR